MLVIKDMYNFNFLIIYYLLKLIILSINHQSMSSKSVKAYDQDFIDYLLLLRFGPSPNYKCLKPVLNYTSIAKLTKVSNSHVSSLIALGIKAKQENSSLKSKPKAKLSE